ncbi:MAG: 3-oxo-tetronate kinase [Gemmobacter sp.]
MDAGLKLGAVADDLTGATDLALILAEGGMSVRVAVGVPGDAAELGDADAVVVALKSRTIAPAEAVAQSFAAARVLGAAGARQILFKYCSTFDSTDAGNIGPVTDALMALLGTDRTIACPAFPANGRTIYQGHLFVGDRLLSESGMQDHPLTPMRDPDLVRVLGRQTARPVTLIPHPTVARGAGAIGAALAAGGPGIRIVDALSDDDLRAIGRAVAPLPLVTGGSGIALGLPANFGITARPGGPRWPQGAIAPGRAAVLAGSCSGATRAQVARARAAGAPVLRVDPAEIAAGRMRPADVLDFALAEARGMAPIIYSSADPDEVARARSALGAGAAGEMVEAFFADLAVAMAERGFTRLLVAGGETSGAVIAALGVGVLDVGPKVAPGVPWMRARGAREGLALLLKSGNFGAPDIFLAAWEHLA